MTTSAPRFTPFRGSIAGLCVPLSNASLRPRGSPTVAVGTALSGGPPHRSQRAELPHWAPRSGPTPVHSSTNRRTRSSTLDAPVPALCPEHVVLAAFPSRCVAVGTALAGGPPHRSQRAELPHWAPASGQTRTRTPRRDAPSWFLRATSRTRSSSRDTPIPALCPGRVSPSVFPLAGPLSSPASADAALFGGFAGTTGPSDFPRSFISGLPPLAFPERPAR